MSLTDTIRNIVAEIECEYQHSQGLILTEDDLKCHLFRKLYPLFEHDMYTMDNGIKASPLHTEVHYFNEIDELKLRPDIAILNTKDLSILYSINYQIDQVGIRFKETTGKEFEFGGNSLIIELKFCKSKRGIDKRHIQTYKKDIEKMKRLQNRIKERSNGVNKIEGILIVFNKTNRKTSEMDELIQMQLDNIDVLYGTGNVDTNIQNHN